MQVSCLLFFGEYDTKPINPGGLITCNPFSNYDVFPEILKKSKIAAFRALILTSYYVTISFRGPQLKSQNFNNNNKKKEWFICLVPVRLSPWPSRSIRFGDISEALGPRDPKRIDRDEKRKRPRN